LTTETRRQGEDGYSHSFPKLCLGMPLPELRSEGAEVFEVRLTGVARLDLVLWSSSIDFPPSVKRSSTRCIPKRSFGNEVKVAKVWSGGIPAPQFMEFIA
jgi:hypothetical protein